MFPHTLTKTLFLAPLVALTFGAAASAQITSATRTIGGPGGLSSCGLQNPPTVCDGVSEASADLQFTYDHGTSTLTLRVDNTSPVVTGAPNPILRHLYFNVPVGAVTNLALTGQSAAGLNQPAWTLSWDADLQAAPNPNIASPYGRFSACLYGHPAGGIVNPLADTIVVPAGSELVSPVTFTFAVTPAVGATLNASTFANAFSITNNPGKNVNAAAHFDLDGCGTASGCIASAPNCNPAAYMTGSPRIGCTVRFWMSSAPGCAGCLAVSPNPGPTIMLLPPPTNLLSIPVGNPMEVLIGTSLVPSATVVSQWFTIPNDPAFVGMTIYGAAVVLNMQTGLFSVSYQFQFDILPA